MDWHLCEYHKQQFLKYDYVPVLKQQVVVVPPEQCEDCLTEKVKRELLPMVRGQGK